jgi:hypothetical protein
MTAFATRSELVARPPPKPHIAGSVNKRSVGTLAERLFRKHLAAQYCEEGHSFFDVEDRLIEDSVNELREQLRHAVPLYLTAAGIHVHVMESVDFLMDCEDVSDVDGETLARAKAGVEKESLELMLRLCTPE